MTRAAFLLCTLALLVVGARLSSTSASAQETASTFRAGAAAVDVTPQKFPVIVNGNFTERLAQQANDKLHARAIALDDGNTKLVLCVVDTCMMPREVIDQAKSIVAKETGLDISHMTVSATHTHTAPAAMGCLGSRMDPEYTKWLPGKVAEAMMAALKNLQPAKVGWASVDDWEHTHNRRWIYRPDRIQADPFGNPTVRAMMHPGYESPNHVGPSGPVDPGLSVLALQTKDGKPLALFANYSQHYFGASAVSADYYGAFCKHMAKLLGQASGEGPFVALMSQGTSGDLMWMDYSKPKQNITMDAYAEAVAKRALEAWGKVEFHDSVPLGIVEKKVPLTYRVPDEARLKWARETMATVKDRLPTSKPEIYANEAIQLHEKQKTELVLQALRIGDLGITALPNEVFAITGLKLKAQSPFASHFNIELANGAEGYIPPPEQHKLGGYTTWPARTAGLEVQAEPVIVDTLLKAAEEVAGKPRRKMTQGRGAYAETILGAKPLAYWRLDEAVIPKAHDATATKEHAADIEDGVALYLEGPADEAFSGEDINRAMHFAGGRVHGEVKELGDTYSVEFWFWNGLPEDARPVTGYLFSRGPNKDRACPGDHLGISGTHADASPGRLMLYNGDGQRKLLAGSTLLSLRSWHHVVLTRSKNQVRVYLDGRTKPEIEGELEYTLPEEVKDIFLGGRSDGFAGLEGKLDEVSLYNRVLTAEEAAAHYHASGLTPPRARTETSALSPEESLKRIHVPKGFTVDLVAAEPLVLDPVAFDWDDRGRLWVVEMADYPLGMDGNGKPGGRVSILEDTNRDGKYDKRTVFAEGLRFPTGILTWRDGCLITAAPEVLLLRDKDGDGKMDESKALLTGFLEGNQQLRVNGLRWGLDGWVYCANGGHNANYGKDIHITSTLTGEKVALGSRDFRFKPDTGEVDPLSGPAQFGRTRDAWGHWFGVQNSYPLWHYALEDRYLRRNPHVAPPSPKVMLTEPNARVFPASAQEKRFHSFDQAGRFTSACGPTIYGDDALFGRREGVMDAFVCEPFHNVVQHLVLEEDGATFKASRDPSEKLDFFASEDRWCRPVMVRTGPDGSLWVADMYRYMIEHPQWLPTQGKEELLAHYREGDDRGRMYRVFAGTKAPSVYADLSKLDGTGLLSLLASPNCWLRDKAHMMLLWHGDKSVAPQLASFLQNHPSPYTRLHALWLLDGLGALESGHIITALSDSVAGIRESALLLAEKSKDDAVVIKAASLAADPSAKVQLQLLNSLGEWKHPAASAALVKLASSKLDSPLERTALASSATAHLPALASAASSNPTLMETVVRTALGKGDNEIVRDLAAPVLAKVNTSDEPSLRNVSTLLRALRDAGSSLDALAAKQPEDTAWQKLKQSKEELLKKVREFAASEDATPSPVRLVAAAILMTDATEACGAIDLVARWMHTPGAADTFGECVALLSSSSDTRIPTLLLAQWNERTPRQREAVLDALLGREAWALMLLKEIQEGRITSSSLDAQRQTRLFKHPAKTVSKLAGEVIKARDSRQQVLDKFRPALSLTGDPAKGKQTFAQACIACHQLEGVGLAVGPDLRSVVQHPPDKLFTSILDPSAIIEPGFTAYFCDLKSGSQVYGAIASETGSSVTLRLADGSLKPVLRSEINKLQSSNLSLMPDGLEALLTPQSLADLIAYLRQPK
ncbi:PVC-type heme-binding CxxCH protein [Roseimicrobium sp. ORNL1]|uniref:PVC-type heme-binding CxxCH protein n=1 Tax=Roseimicrobium sp. ORNL1 TaxID=2711231 RepID=UPI0013E131BE|nr:PVC-type heme-binding CxxCH protein [Roseimicrobium sp. ORNL1]QIF00603.1 c-type cytochrome [Roseimicrobium sp. ORNL1]